jgi:hypothetical protein
VEEGLEVGVLGRRFEGGAMVERSNIRKAGRGV